MSSQYLLGGGNLAGGRLNLQHTYTRDIFGGHLIDPAIDTDRANLRIADICTGTGIWLLQVARQIPSAEFEGLDTNLSEAPQQAWCPSNINFRKFDIFAATPEDLIGRYDIINVQYTHLFVRDSNIQDVLPKLVSMLKPGGWLQYTDMDARNKRALIPDGSQAPEAISTVVQSAWDMVKFTPSEWTSRLEEHFTDAGLVDVVNRSPEMPLSTLGPSTQCCLWGIEEGCITALGKGWTTKEGAEAVMEKVRKTWSEHKELGAVIDWRTTRCVGRKPLDK